MEQYSRPEWDSYFLAMAIVASTRSTCLRRKVGAVLVSGNRILATGYNGSPSGTKHCLEVGCLRQQLNIPSGKQHEICRGSHAEMNAIAQAASAGTKVTGSTMYCTHEPCSICSKMLINAECVRTVYLYSYPDELARVLRNEAGIISVAYESEYDVISILKSCIPA